MTIEAIMYLYAIAERTPPIPYRLANQRYFGLRMLFTPFRPLVLDTMMRKRKLIQAELRKFIISVEA